MSLSNADKQHNAEVVDRLRVFRDITADICKNSGQVFRTEDLEAQGTAIKDISSAKALCELDDIKFFLVTPLYTLGATEDILTEFIMLKDPDILLGTVASSKPIAQGLRTPQGLDWNYRVDAIQDTELDNLTEYLTSKVIKKGEKYVAVKYLDLRIPDPLGKLRHDGSKYKLDVRVFYPLVKHVMLIPRLLPSGVIGFSQQTTPAPLRAELHQLQAAIMNYTQPGVKHE